MAGRAGLSEAELLERLLGALLGPERERDEAAAEAVLEMEGVDRAAADEGLRRRLEREVAERRGRGEEVPRAFLDALANPPPMTLPACLPRRKSYPCH